MLDRSFGDDLIEAQTAAFAAAERTGDGFGQVISLGYLSAGMMLHGDQEEAAREDDDAETVNYAQLALAHFEEAGDRIWGFRASWVVGWHSARLGDLDAARTIYDQLMAASLEAGAPLGVAHTHLGHGYVAHLAGRCDDALRHYGLAGAGFVEYGQESNAAYVKEHVGDVLWDLGDATGAIGNWREAESVYAEFRARRELDRVRAKLARGRAGTAGPLRAPDESAAASHAPDAAARPIVVWGRDDEGPHHRCGPAFRDSIQAQAVSVSKSVARSASTAGVYIASPDSETLATPMKPFTPSTSTTRIAVSSHRSVVSGAAVQELRHSASTPGRPSTSTSLYLISPIS
jgi:tetratricopeptide (TPR) repeat protein